MSDVSDRSDHASSALSSSEDSDLELEPGEYERRRELYWSKVLFSERKFQELRAAYAKLRMDRVEKLQSDILNQSSDAYLARKGTLDEEFQRKRERNMLLKVLRTEALKRRLEGDRVNAERQKEDEKRGAKEAIVMAAKERVERQREIQRITNLSFTNGLSHSLLRDEPIVAAPSSSDQITSFPTASTATAKWDIGHYWLNIDAEEDGDVLWQNVPAMIAQLPKHKIAEDLQRIQTQSQDGEDARLPIRSQ